MTREERAKRMRFYAERARMKPRDLAHVLGVTEQAVNSWMRGSRFPKDETLSRFCILVGTDLSGFYGPIPRVPRRKKPEASTG